MLIGLPHTLTFLEIMTYSPGCVVHCFRIRLMMIGFIFVTTMQ